VTLTVVGYLIAAALLVGGIVAARQRRGGQGLAILAGAIVLAVVVGWFAWLTGTAA